MNQIDTKFIIFWGNLFTKPKAFFSNNINDDNQLPAYFNLALIVYGIGYGIDRLDRQLTKFDLKGRLDEVEFINSWFGYWLVAIIGGLIGGYLSYLIGGWFFNIRLKWSKGTSNLNKSRYIFLYSSVVSSSIIILTTIISMFINNKPYDPESEFNLWDLTTLILLVFSIYYSVYVSYSGVRAITDAEKSRSIIWFLVVPMTVYTITYITVILIIYNYLS